MQSIVRKLHTIFAAVILEGHVATGYVEVKFEFFENERDTEAAYEFGRKLGDGVTEAIVMKKNPSEIWEQTAEKVAIKEVDTKEAAKREYDVSRILHNGKRLGGLSYVHGFGNIISTEGHPTVKWVIVMDVVEGITLEESLEKRASQAQPLKIRFTLELIVNLLSIFKSMHAVGVAHNDLLNTKNIMLIDPDNGKPTGFTIIDFGRATLHNESPIACKNDLQAFWAVCFTFIVLDVKAPNFGILEDSTAGTQLYEALSDMRSNTFSPAKKLG